MAAALRDDGEEQALLQGLALKIVQLDADEVAAITRAARRPAGPDESLLHRWLPWKRDAGEPAALPPRFSSAEAAKIKELGEPAMWLANAYTRLPVDVARLLEHRVFDREQLLNFARTFDAACAADFGLLVGGLDRFPQPPDGLEELPKALVTLLRLRQRIPLGRAYTIARHVEDHLVHQEPGLRLLDLGSLRRFEETVGDISLLAETTNPADVRDALATLSGARLSYLGERRSTLQVRQEDVNIVMATPDETPTMLAVRTGSANHVRVLAARAASRGWALTARGLFDRSTGRQRPLADESELYATLELPYVPPELRHGADELDVAASRGFRDLVEVTHIRGDLHMHSLWSDGRDTIDTMVRAAVKIGYEYVAITDHSPSAAASRVVTVDKLARQMDEVRALRRLHPQITILHGLEVDILPDGSLDCPDEQLAALDIVLASLHDRADQTGDELTARCVIAMRNPLVSMLTHPGNRAVGRQDVYPLDYGELFRVARETGTLLEVDGAPNHLDMDGAMARAAAAAGAMIAIDSDSHQASQLGRQMLFGVSTARRGGIARHQVINTRSIEEVIHFLAKKRAGAPQRARLT